MIPSNGKPNGDARGVRGETMQIRDTRLMERSCANAGRSHANCVVRSSTRWPECSTMTGHPLGNAWPLARR